VLVVCEFSASMKHSLHLKSFIFIGHSVILLWTVIIEMHVESGILSSAPPPSGFYRKWA
jgi:hypothetical protein